eukprot:scaffold59306_cov21-Phaeocystis_antarctica.AAC.1
MDRREAELSCCQFAWEADGGDCEVCVRRPLRRARTAAARRAAAWDEVEGGTGKVGGTCPGGEV